MKIAERYLRLAREHLHQPLLSFIPVGGGSINHCFRAETPGGIYFLKENDAQKFPGMFEAEMKGLELLRETGTFCVPRCIACGEENGKSFLVMEWLEKQNGNDRKSAGKLLAQLHRNNSEFFGLDHSNYIGSLPQSNTYRKTWAEFFASERILPQMKLASDNGRADKKLLKQAENFCRELKNIFPEEKPSLLHGDLWSGNFLFSAKGPAIFDPAVYYGHREMDLAMTKLFGGFDADFYAGYEAEFPPEKNWRSRVGFCNLYPLLVHVNLFGGGYVQEVKNLLSHF